VIDAIAAFGAGLFACYYGFGDPPIGRDATATARWQQWHGAWSKSLRISGVALVMSGMLGVMIELI
jgi:hypothetical protein